MMGPTMVKPSWPDLNRFQTVESGVRVRKSMLSRPVEPLCHLHQRVVVILARIGDHLVEKLS